MRRSAIADIPVEIENVQRWSASAEYAERLAKAAIFLAGDAVHVMPPTGGFGGNCGIQDGYDLAWKLAYVLDGRAGEELLATYDAERSPVGAFTTEQAYTRYVLRLDPSLGTENLQPIVDEATVELGYRYRSTAIAAPGDDDTCGRTRANPRAGRDSARRTSRSATTARRSTSSGATSSWSQDLTESSGSARRPASTHTVSAKRSRRRTASARAVPR